MTTWKVHGCVGQTKNNPNKKCPLLTGHNSRENQTIGMGESKKRMEMSLDKLTVCGNQFGDLEGFLSRSLEVERKSFAKYPYRESFHFMDGSVLQVAELEVYRSGKIKLLRYEFNPNNKKFEKLHSSILGLMKEAHCTRADIAFDIRDIDMSHWKWIDSKGRPFNVYYSGTGEVETWYVGGKTSEVKIRIYNKIKERKLSEGVWWRVEVQVRGTYATMLENVLEPEHFNPFKDVTPIVNGSFPELDIKRRAMVNYLIENPSGFAELASQARSEYRKLLRLIGSWECIDFYSVWNEKSSLLGSEVRSWLTYTKVF